MNSNLTISQNLIPSKDNGILPGKTLAVSHKPIHEHNPVSSNIYFADPTVVEYNGRLYVYGTNDSQEYDKCDGSRPNSYGGINSLVCYSTADMVNWTYENTIKVTEICTWAGCSWAPSIVSRVEADGLTHFYLYFCNSGNGIGVLTSTSPVGPWSDPNGKALMHNGLLGNDPTCWCFDPGVCIDDNGVGWLAFGGGNPLHEGENALYTGNSRIVKLGADMVSLDGEVVVLKSPYHFEANELNFINGTYVLTYCSNWAKRELWEDKFKFDKPHVCSMCYCVSKDPLNPDSWEYMGEYLLNPDQFGYPGSNNHTHMHKFGDKYYIFYQNVSLAENKGEQIRGYRSIGVDEIEVDENAVVIKSGRMTDAGCTQLKNFDPYAVNSANTSAHSAGVKYDAQFKATVTDGSYIALKNVDFLGGAAKFAATLCGKGAIEVRLDDVTSEAVCTLQFDSADFITVVNDMCKSAEGVHDLYLVCGGEFTFDCWQFA